MAPSVQANTLGFIPGLPKTFAPGSVSVAHPRVCISKNIAGVPVANRSLHGAKAASFRSVRMVAPVSTVTGLQSPINVPNNGTEAVPIANAPVIEQGTHVIARSELTSSGTNLEMKVEGGDFPGTVTFNGITYELDQLHLHTPSENTLDGRSFPMEMHLVHVSQAGEVLVLAIWYDNGPFNAEFDKVLDAIQSEGTQAALSVEDMLGAGLTRAQLLTFQGSLTTPPFTTGLQWVVSKEIAKVSPDQITRYQNTPHVVVPNNRNTQDLQERTVTAYF